MNLSKSVSLSADFNGVFIIGLKTDASRPITNLAKSRWPSRKKLSKGTRFEDLGDFIMAYSF